MPEWLQPAFQYGLPTVLLFLVLGLGVWACRWFAVKVIEPFMAEVVTAMKAVTTRCITYIDARQQQEAKMVDLLDQQTLLLQKQEEQLASIWEGVQANAGACKFTPPSPQGGAFGNKGRPPRT